MTSGVGPGMTRGISLDCHIIVVTKQHTVRGMMGLAGIFAPLWKVSKFGALPSPSRVLVDHGKIEVSHVTAKVDTGMLTC